MKETPFGFSYSWSDMKVVRFLAYTLFGGQIIGALVGFFVVPFPDAFDRIWFGGAVITFPAYLVGLLLQARFRPGTLSANKVMVRRMGLIAIVLSAIAVALSMGPMRWR